METDNISAITGIANKLGDHRKEVKNRDPNPGNYWMACVLFEDGWKHYQAVGKEKVVRWRKKVVKQLTRTYVVSFVGGDVRECYKREGHYIHVLNHGYRISIDDPRIIKVKQV